MTEYEIADLAASSASKLQGAVSLLQAALTMMTDIIQQYMAILFGYIVAAYFIGASLTRRQASILTTLYAMWQIWMIGVIAGRGYLARLIMERIQDLQGASSAAAGVPLVLTTVSIILLIGALFASLYFMWCVRHPRTECQPDPT
jgi:hypothetical protein